MSVKRRPTDAAAVGGSASVSVICAGGAEHWPSWDVSEHQPTNPAQYRPEFWKP